MKKTREFQSAFHQMGKLLQKLVHGIVPSWLSKIKASTETSSTKLLPSSNICSASSAPASDRPSGVVGGAHGELDEETYGREGSLPSTTMSSSSKTEKESRKMNGRSKQHDQQHHHEHEVDPHPAMEDVLSNVVFEEQSPASSVPSSFRKQVKPTMDKGYQGYGTGSDLPEDHLNSTHHQLPLDYSKGLITASPREPNCAKEEERNQNLDNGGHKLHEAEDGLYTNAVEHKGFDYQELPGMKRKTLSSLSEEELQEEEEEGGRGKGEEIEIQRYWKRRKGEMRGGMMSIELPDSICGIVGNGKAVVKHSQDPHQVLSESMVEMIVGNGLWEWGNLEFLFLCYLSLNEPHLHHIIQSSFLQVLRDLKRTYT